MKGFRVAGHVQQAVALPINIGKFRNDVAGQRGVAAHLLDFPFQRKPFLLLRGVREGVVVREGAV